MDGKLYPRITSSAPELEEIKNEKKLKNAQSSYGSYQNFPLVSIYLEKEVRKCELKNEKVILLNKILCT